MSRLNTLLLMLLIACALSTVDATNHQRELFIELGRVQSEAHQMAQTGAELQYQQGALSKTTLIEHVAQDQLKMQPVTPGRTQYLVANVAADGEPGGSTGAVSELPNGVASTGIGASAAAPSASQAGVASVASGARR